MDRRFWSTVLLLLVVVGCATTNDADQDDNNKPEEDLKGKHGMVSISISISESELEFKMSSNVIIYTAYIHEFTNHSRSNPTSCVGLMNPIIEDNISSFLSGGDVLSEKQSTPNEGVDNPTNTEEKSEEPENADDRKPRVISKVLVVKDNVSGHKHSSFSEDKSTNRGDEKTTLQVKEEAEKRIEEKAKRGPIVEDESPDPEEVVAHEDADGKEEEMFFFKEEPVDEYDPIPDDPVENTPSIDNPVEVNPSEDTPLIDEPLEDTPPADDLTKDTPAPDDSVKTDDAVDKDEKSSLNTEGLESSDTNPSPERRDEDEDEEEETGSLFDPGTMEGSGGGEKIVETQSKETASTDGTLKNIEDKPITIEDSPPSEGVHITAKDMKDEVKDGVKDEVKDEVKETEQKSEPVKQKRAEKKIQPGAELYDEAVALLKEGNKISSTPICLIYSIQMSAPSYFAPFELKPAYISIQNSRILPL